MELYISALVENLHFMAQREEIKKPEGRRRRDDTAAGTWSAGIKDTVLKEERKRQIDR